MYGCSESVVFCSILPYRVYIFVLNYVVEVMASLYLLLRSLSLCIDEHWDVRNVKTKLSCSLFLFRLSSSTLNAHTKVACFWYKFKWIQWISAEIEPKKSHFEFMRNQFWFRGNNFPDRRSCFLVELFWATFGLPAWITHSVELPQNVCVCVREPLSKCALMSSNV